MKMSFAEFDQMIEKAQDTVINDNGHKLSFEAAVMYMDDEIRETLHDKLAPCKRQEFFTAYEKAHIEKYGEEWELSKKNPVW